MGAYINGDYKSEYSGDQIDAAIGKVRTPDSTPTASSDNLVTSGGVKAALDQKQAVINDLSTIRQGASDGSAALTATNEIEQLMGQGYKYYGVATPSTNPGTLEQKVFYIASQPGTYTNLGGIVVNDGEVCTLMWNETSWSKQVTGAATAAQVSQLGQKVFADNQLMPGLIDSFLKAKNESLPGRVWGSNNTYITLTKGGLYEIQTSASINVIYGNDSASVSNPKAEFVPFHQNGKYYVFVTDEMYAGNIKYLVIEALDSTNVSGVKIYSPINAFSVVYPADSVSKPGYYIPAAVGIYSNCGGLEKYEEEVCLFSFDGTTWSKILTGFIGINIYGFAVGSYINYSTGESVSNSQYQKTVRIPVNVGDVIYHAGYTGSVVAPVAAFGDAGYIGSLLEPEASTFYRRVVITNPDIKYVIISSASANHASFQWAFAGVNYKNINLRDVFPIYNDWLSFGKKVNNFEQSAEKVVHGYIGPDGTIGASSSYILTDYIPVKFGDRILYTGNVGGIACCVYGYVTKDAPTNGIVIIADGTFAKEIVPIPIGINYIRACSKAGERELVILSKKVGKIAERYDASHLDFKGKKIAVIGDSISTGKDLNPFYKILSSDVGNEIQSWVTFYDVYTISGNTDVPTNKTIGGVLLTDAMIGTLQTFVPAAEDVGKSIGVAPSYYSATSDKTWPYKLCQKLGAELINASWSGASMCSGQDGDYMKISYAWHDCTIGRCKTRAENGNEVVPDIIIIYRGTNDFSHNVGGGFAYLDADYSLMDNGYPDTDLFDTNKHGFYRAYYLTIKKLRDAYPNAVIYCATLNVFKRIIYDRFPTRNGRNTLPQFNDAIREIANTMGCGLIEFDKDGITFENCYAQGYIDDSATTPTHPSLKGQSVMANKALQDLTYYIRDHIWYWNE